MERLRTLSEAECYERCYGWRHDEDTVKVLPRAQAGGVDERAVFALAPAPDGVRAIT